MTVNKLESQFLDFLIPELYRIFFYPFSPRALRTMIDLGRITVKCIDCPQIFPVAGDLTMNGENRHIYRLGYKGAQSFGVKVNRDKLFFKKTPQ